MTDIEDETVRMTVPEIALMREIVKWRRANGVAYWRARTPIGRFVSWKVWSQGEVVWDPSAHEDRHLGHDDRNGSSYEWVRVANVTQAVDVLVALGYLPKRFSTAYRAGWDNAMDAERVGLGYEMPVTD